MAPEQLHVLVVEDEADMCWALRTVVEAEGHGCTVVQRGGDALEIVRETPIDLAFLDLKLPDIEGLELAARLHALRADLRCVLVSGYLYDDDEPVQAALRSNQITGFIGKPFLLGQVRDALRQAQPRRD